MKTTSYEISKQLKEAGFEAETDYYFYGQQLRNSAFPSHSTDADRKVHVKSYDLETILDALPTFIMYNECKDTFLDKDASCYYLFLWNNTLGYYGECHEYRDNYSMGDGIFEFSKSPLNESLADTAGRMWLELKKKNLL